MKRRPFLVLAFVCIALMFVGFISASQNLLAGLRFDATGDRLYTLSQSTKQTLRGLNSPITLTFYASREKLNSDPILRAYSDHVRELLHAYRALSGGRLTLEERDPAPFSQSEDAALNAGLTPLTSQTPGESPAYLGLVLTNKLDQTTLIPALLPERETSLEYDLTRAIAELSKPSRHKLTILTSLPWLFAPNASGTAMMPVAKVAQELSQSFDMTVLSKDFTGLPPETSVLLIAQPWRLTPAQEDILDTYGKAGGSIIVLLDPASSVAKDGGGGELSATAHLGRLDQAWGFSVQSDVVLDKAHALPVESSVDGREMVLDQPLYFQIPPSGLNRKSLIVAGLTRGVNFGTPGEVTFREDARLSFEPLLTTSHDTMRMDAGRALANIGPVELLQNWHSSGSSYVIGGLIAPQARTGTGPHVLIVGDVDFLADSFYANGSAEAADNAAFLLNAVDMMNGSAQLVGLRSRAPALRPLVVIERIRREAQERLLEEQSQLEARLKLAQERLARLEAADTSTTSARATDSDDLVQESQAREVRKEVLETRAKLRHVQLGAQVSIDRIKSLLILINAVIVPLCVVILGVFVLAHQRRKRRRTLRQSALATTGKT